MSRTRTAGAAGAVAVGLVLAAPGAAWASLDDRVVVSSSVGYAQSAPLIQTLQADGDDPHDVGLGAPVFDATSLLETAQWSPDATRLLVRTVESQGDTARAIALRVLQADGSGATVLATDVAPGTGTATWSPDGGRAAYVTGTDGGQALALVDVRDGTRTRVDTGHDDMAGLSWSPDSGLLTFTSATGDSTRGVFAVAPDGSGVRLLADGVYDPGFRRAVSWSPDGDALALPRLASDGAVSVSVVDRDGTERVALGAGDTPVWSPDGSSVALADAGQVVLADPVTGSRAPVADDLADGLRVLQVTGWSADSRDVSVLVVSDLPTSFASQVYALDVATGAATRVDSPSNGGKYGGAGSFAPLPTALPPTRSTDVACPPGSVPDAGFTDTGGSTFAAQIDCVAWYGVARGTTATTYSPAATVTRAQMARFLVRTAQRAGVDLDTSDAGFTDLGQVPQEGRDAINALAHLGVAQGVTATRFDPAGSVSRGQMATFLVRLQEAVGGAPLGPRVHCFADVSTSVHRAAAERLCGAGIASGTGGGSYLPSSPVTRGQMAGFLARLLDVQVEQGLVELPS